MKPVLDIKKTLGQLNFLGVDEKYKYEMESVLIKLFMHIN